MDLSLSGIKILERTTELDGIPEARGIMVGIFLDDVTSCNAPVLAIPGSHKNGLVSEAVIDEEVGDHEGVTQISLRYY